MDKIAKLKIAVSSRVTSVACPPDAPHVGYPFKSLAAVTPDEVRKILSSLPSKSSPTVLGPILFSLYTSPIGSIAFNFNISLQQYADDTQFTFQPLPTPSNPVSVISSFASLQFTRDSHTTV